MEIRELFDRLGGSAAIAAGIGQPFTTVQSWKDRESIPAWHWDDLIKFARNCRVPLNHEHLAKMAAEKRVN